MPGETFLGWKVVHRTNMANDANIRKCRKQRTDYQRMKYVMAKTSRSFPFSIRKEYAAVSLTL